MSWFEGAFWLLLDLAAFTLLAVPIWWLLDLLLRTFFDYGF